MKFKNYKLHFRFIFCLLLLSLVLHSVIPAQATSHIDDLENTTSELEHELSGLENELDALDAELNAISSEIRDTYTELESTREELAIARGKEQAQYEAMALRIKYMYENGSTSFLEILLESRSMAEFINKAEYIASITEYDRAMLDEFAATSDFIAAKELKLQEEQAHLSSLQKELDEKEQTLQEKIDSTSIDLSSYLTKLEQAREEAKKAEETAKEEIIPVAPPSEENGPDASEENDSDASEELPDDSESEPEEDSKHDGSSGIEASASDVELLAALIECEAGTSDYEGMLAVGSVVMNRINSRYYPDTLRGVIYQRGQFPPALNGKVERVLNRGVHDNCVVAAQDALSGKNNVGDCLQFRSASSGHAGTIIGDNVFF